MPRSDPSGIFDPGPFDPTTRLPGSPDPVNGGPNGGGGGGGAPKNPNDPTAGQNGCDCKQYAYEKGNPCYAQCAGKNLSDHDWYVQEIQSKPSQYDTGISEGQWIAWRSFWDDASKSFRNENVDSAGNAIGGTGFNKPVDCPAGTTKFNINQCLPLSDWRVAAGDGTPKAAPKPGAAPAPVKTDVPDYSQLPYGNNDLRNALADMFNYRAGIFGTKDPHLSGATSRAPAGQEVAGAWLPGGGAWWGGAKDLASELSSFGHTFTTGPTTTTSSVVNKPPVPTGQACPTNYHWDGIQNKCIVDVSTNIPGPVVQTTLPTAPVGPLASALLNSGYPKFT